MNRYFKQQEFLNRYSVISLIELHDSLPDGLEKSEIAIFLKFCEKKNFEALDLDLASDFPKINRHLNDFKNK